MRDDEIIDAEFQYVETRWRFRFWPVAAWCFWTGIASSGIYQLVEPYSAEDAGTAIIMIIFAALIVPVGNLCSSIGRKASHEESEALRSQLLRRAQSRREIARP